MDNDKLAALDKAATQGVWKETERSGYRELLAPDDGCDWYGDPKHHAVAYIDTELDEVEQDANAAFITALVNRYRAGELVPVSLDADTAGLVERLEHCSKNTRDEYLHELTGRSATALRTITAERDALAKRVGDADLLEWLAANPSLELKYEGWEDDVWEVYRVNGGRSDREWTLVATGGTPADALRAARATLKGTDHG